ncbi:hypothetical protein GWI33_008475, partial [Rhynchophorus ferrugineus]
EPICHGENMVIKKGGFCKCCNTCIRVLGEGEACGQLDFLRGTPPVSECASGLACVDHTCQKLSDILRDL